MATTHCKTVRFVLLAACVAQAGGHTRRVERLVPAHHKCQAPCGQSHCCQNTSPAAPNPIWSVDSASSCGAGELSWASRGCGDWQRYAQGEYVGHARLPHVPDYRIRVGDQLSVFYLRTRRTFRHAYHLQIGDRVRVESLTAGSIPSSNRTSGSGASDDKLDREVVVQPDGMITLPLVNRVPAAKRTVEALQDDLESRYKEWYKVPAITVTPVQVNTKLEDLVATVDSRAGSVGGLRITLTVSPDGTIQVPGLTSIYIQGLTPDEAKQEIDARYDATIPGIEVTVALLERAPRFIYVLGQVTRPGRFTLEGPTSVIQAIALAEGSRLGGNLRQVVVFRRGDDWRLMATMVDVRGALYGRRPVPADDIWLNDSDVVLVPKSAIQIADDIIEQVFTRGVYAAFPREIVFGIDFASGSAL